MDLDTGYSFITEGLSDKAKALAELGWTAASGSMVEGVDLHDIHHAAPVLREMAASHPLHIRGAQLRHSYTFGQGMKVAGITTPKTLDLMHDTHFHRVISSVTAQRDMAMEEFTTGNVFLFKNLKTNRFTLVPIEEIAEIFTDDFDESDIRAVRREWTTGKNKRMSEWFPIARHKAPNFKSVAEGKPLNREYVVYHKKAVGFAGSPLGVPTSLGAALWSVAYSNYLADSASLTHILKQIAWRISRAQNAQGAQQAALTLTRPQKDGEVGGTASMAGDQMLQSVGVPSAQVDFNNGQPLAALVAASFGVPVIALLSSPGATGGSYGAATTLDKPTLEVFRAEQDTWEEFNLEIYKDLVPKVKREHIEISFPAIEQDPAYRKMASASLAFEGGAIWPDEYRQAALEALDLADLHEGKVPPKPEPEVQVTPAQGKSGAVAGGMNQDDTNHDGDEE